MQPNSRAYASNSSACDSLPRTARLWAKAGTCQAKEGAPHSLGEGGGLRGGRRTLHETHVKLDLVCGAGAVLT